MKCQRYSLFFRAHTLWACVKHPNYALEWNSFAGKKTLVIFFFFLSDKTIQSERGKTVEQKQEKKRNREKKWESNVLE